MNEIKGKHASLMKAMQIGERALGKINKKVNKLSQEAEDKKIAVDITETKLELAKFTKDEVSRQQEDIKLSLCSLFS